MYFQLLIRIGSVLVSMIEGKKILAGHLAGLEKVSLSGRAFWKITEGVPDFVAVQSNPGV